MPYLFNINSTFLQTSFINEETNNHYGYKWWFKKVNEKVILNVVIIMLFLWKFHMLYLSPVSSWHSVINF